MAEAPQEIERVYLLRGLPAIPEHAESLDIEQGYLPDRGDGTVEGRLRRVRRADGAVRCTRTVKEGLGLVRTERQQEISAEEFARQWPRTAGRRLRKTRFVVREDPLVWEIDRFDDLDLVLAEVELPSADVRPPLPSWLEPHVEREVTDEPAYRSYSLAQRAGHLDRT